MNKSDSRPDLPEELGARLEAYRAGALELEDQRAFEREILSHPELARALYQSEGIDAALLIAQQRRSRRRIPWRIAVPAAAAAVLLLSLLPRLIQNPTVEPAPTFRGSETELVALAPLGEVSGEAIQFQWTRIDGAQRYRIEVFDADSAQILERETAGTEIVVPAWELSALANAGGFWRVSALGKLDSVLATSSPAPVRLR